MNARAIVVLSVILGFSMCRVEAADTDSSFPAIIRKGLLEYERGGATLAFYAWQHGGLMDDDAGAAAKLRGFKDVTEAMGKYRSAEEILRKRIGNSSQILYTALNFKRGAVYVKFWLYRGENDWVVQNFVFSTRPETIMPWLAIEGDSQVQE